MTAWRIAVVGALLLTGCRVDQGTPEVDPTPPVTEPAPTTPTTEATASPSDPAATSPSPDPTESAPPPFATTVEEVVGHPAEDRMRGVSWREGCPVPLAELRYLTVTHHDMDGGVQTGELVVRASVVDDVLTAFERLYELEFPITQMRLVDDFGADDDASMRADNTSAFNCRTVAGTDRWSNHAYGEAIDINPLRNPYVRGDRVDPPEGAPYADRDDHRPGMLHAGSPEVAAFTDLGWDWGGAWSSGQDYQHVSATGG